ncbi:unnamed protein product, partial [Cuscuta epithymum]
MYVMYDQKKQAQGKIALSFQSIQHMTIG